MDDTAPGVVAVMDRKAELRAAMRTMRRALPEREDRSRAIVQRLGDLDAVRSARRIMGFATIPGEPELAPFALDSFARDQEFAVPADDRDSLWPDVVIVPGLAFTRVGERLGQGGGWYDRFLASVRPSCPTIGVAFEPQVVDELPLEAHDLPVNGLVTEAGVWWST